MVRNDCTCIIFILIPPSSHTCSPGQGVYILPCERDTTSFGVTSHLVRLVLFQRVYSPFSCSNSPVAASIPVRDFWSIVGIPINSRKRSWEVGLNIFYRLNVRRSTSTLKKVLPNNIGLGTIFRIWMYHGCTISERIWRNLHPRNCGGL